MKLCCIQKNKLPGFLMFLRRQWIGLLRRVDYRGFQDTEECLFLSKPLRCLYPITPSIIGLAWSRCYLIQEKAYATL